MSWGRRLDHLVRLLERAAIDVGRIPEPTSRAGSTPSSAGRTCVTGRSIMSHADGSVLEDAQPGLRPKHALPQVLDCPLARDHPLDPLHERDLASADAAALHRVRELVANVDLNLLRAGRARVAGGGSGRGFDETVAARAPEDREGMRPAGAAVAERDRAAGRAAPLADLGRDHAPVHVWSIRVV